MQPPPTWSNPDILLFHGTSYSSARNIMQSGVDVTRSQPDRDFGPGFYCTTVHDIAANRAIQKVSSSGEAPTIVEFTLPRVTLASLATISFVRADDQAHDFWSLISFFRDFHALSMGDAYRQLFPYDVAIGPIILWRTRKPMPHSDQISFHTHVAETVLNSAARRRMITV